MNICLVQERGIDIMNDTNVKIDMKVKVTNLEALLRNASQMQNQSTTSSNNIKDSEIKFNRSENNENR